MTYWKKSTEEIPVEDTAIWSCTDEECNGWMRENFTFQMEPTCPLCDAPMDRGTKMLPQLANSNELEQKRAK